MPKNADPQNPISRRSFLKMTCVTTAAIATANLTLTACGSGDPEALAPAEGKTIDLPSYTFGDLKMDQRILVAYASGTGSTVGVAEAIGKTLAESGAAADVRPVKEDPAVDGYQSVVIGSAVNGGKWLPEALAYVEDHRQALNRVPVAVFCVHGMNTADDEQCRKKRLAYLDPVRVLIQPVDEAFFAGIGMNPDEGSWLARWAYRKFGGSLEGDCRDWNKIRAWAASLPEMLA